MSEPICCRGCRKKNPCDAIYCCYCGTGIERPEEIERKLGWLLDIEHLADEIVRRLDSAVRSCFVNRLANKYNIKFSCDDWNDMLAAVNKLEK